MTGEIVEVAAASERAQSAPRKGAIDLATVLGVGALSSAAVAKTSPDCVARLHGAALQAMERSNPLGQLQIFGGPTSFGPHLKRIEVGVYGARTETYAVDLPNDSLCNVLGATTRLETNEWPAR